MDLTLAEPDIAVGASAMDGEKKPQRERRQHTPPEELYDLSQPIPREDKPDKAKHDAEVEAISSEIDSLKDQKNKLQDKIEAALNANRSSIPTKERNAMKDLRNTKGKLIDEKKILQKSLEKLKKDTENLMNDRKAAKANIRFYNVEDIDKEIMKLKDRQETTSMSLMEEKNLIKEIESLQKSKELVNSFKQTDASIDDSKTQRKLISEQLKAKDAEIDAVQAKIADKQKDLDSMKSSQDEQRKGVDGMKQQRDELKKQIGDKMNQRTEIREKFRVANNKWVDYQRDRKSVV